MGKNIKKKIQLKQYIVVAFFIIIGLVCGFLMGGYLDSIFASDSTFGEYLFSYALLLAGMYAALFLTGVIHETGHLIFGLLTGYRYSSFRIGSFMWVKESGKMKFKRLSITGIGGQCLMIPPEISDGKFPFILYNLGGSLANIVSGVIFFGLYLLFKDVPHISIFLLILSIIGVAYALINGIPMRLGTVDNDGYNTLSIGKNNKSLFSFWIQMKVNEQVAKGIRLKDMPEDWFFVPSEDEMKNSIVAVVGVFACNRLMDAHLFKEADQIMNQLLGIDSGIVGLHRNLMICDRVYCELIGENRKDLLEAMLDKQQKKSMKSMRNFPSVLRTKYSYALLAENDVEKAVKIKAQFEKCALTYPYSSDIESERELIYIADFTANKQEF